LLWFPQEKKSDEWLDLPQWQVNAGMLGSIFLMLAGHKKTWLTWQKDQPNLTDLALKR